MAKRLQRTTTQQYEELLHYIKENRILLTGKTKPSEAGKINTLWQKCANHINSQGIGPEKTGNQWRKVSCHFI